ncbi:MAG TPA: glycosyltransferase family 1 protein, partial [Verrucomicrobiae bacterium]|nr:glycosyltransferase family 1 protein [Verrucomicrobiae bacterium]
MRIGISSLMIQRGKTGVASYLFSLLQGFQKAATSHLFFLFVFEEDLPLFDSLKSDMSLIPVPERYRPPVRNILWHQSALPRLARHYSLDVLHVPSYRRLLWPKPCPLVATIHDLAPFHVTGKYDWKRMFYGRVVVRRLAMRQDRVIAVSHNTAADLVRFFRLREAQIKVIHNGIDHRRFTPGSAPEAKARVAHRLGLTSPFFLYVARLEHPGKNHLRLIQAFEKFKNSCKSEFQLVFAGSDWHGAEAIHRAIQNSPHKKDIRSLGFVSLEELPELYRAAEVFVYPSLFEGFGFPPLEAMACGCPVISSTRGSLEEIVGTAALTVDPENVDEMSY